MNSKITGWVFNIQKFSIHDGPGIRTLVFFKGCPLKCLWCSNPEGMDHNKQLMFKTKQCKVCRKCMNICIEDVHQFVTNENDSKHTMIRKSCVACGKCVEICPNQSLKLVGAEVSIEDVFHIVMQDRIFYQTSGGGITLGGGEPTMQTEFALELLKRCKENGINTTLETCAFTSWENLERIAQYVDYFLVDLKHMNSKQHKEGTGETNDLILRNIVNLLKNDAPVTIRIPIIPDFNDSESNMLETALFLNKHNINNSLAGVELLPYHKWGIGKYDELGLQYKSSFDKSISEASLNGFRGIFTNHLIQVIL